MFKSINNKFYAIVVLLVIMFCTGYAFLIYFLNLQSEKIISDRDTALIEKDFFKLNGLFHQARFWEKVIFTQNNLDAEMEYVTVMDQARGFLNSLNEKKLNEEVKFNLKEIIEKIDQYENNFNHLIQLKTRQRLLSTRMETNYHSMSSIVLINNNPMLLKPIFNLSNFLGTYRSKRNAQKYQVLNIMINSFEKKIQIEKNSISRMQGYVSSFRELLSEDYSIELEIISTNEVLEGITNDLQDYLKGVLSEIENNKLRRIQETTKMKRDLKGIFLIYGLSGFLVILFTMYLFSINIIVPIKAIALVMEKVQEGAFGARFINHTNHEDDITKLGLSFNNMLTTLENNNQKILNYQKDLEKKLIEITKQKEEREALQSQLLQAEKLASLGQLAAGVAHEINNPVGFVKSNLGTMEDYRLDITKLLESYATFESIIMKTDKMNEILSIKNAIESTKKIKEDIDIDFIMADYSGLIEESKDGMERVVNIVGDLKNFAHMDKAELEYADINHGIESTLNLVGNELKYKAKVIKDLGDVPLIKCYPQQLNQIFTNLLVNAAHAIEKKGEIKIFTATAKDRVIIKISDTGCGIPQNIIDKIYDPFFTTKDVGKGTGLGLNVVHNIIQTHQGTIDIDSEVDKGSTFTITLPIEPAIVEN